MGRERDPTWTKEAQVRRLIITRGAQGLGKSTLIRRLNLERVTLCPDDLRGLWGGALITEGGRWEVNHRHEPQVWSFLNERLQERMSRGELIVVDATHTYLPGLLTYIELMRLNGYRGLCVDFSSASLEEAIVGNERRPWRKRVPVEVVRRTWTATQTPLPSEVQEGFEWLNWQGERSLEAARAWLRSEERSLAERQRPQVFWGVAQGSEGTAPHKRALETLMSADPEDPTVWLSPLHTLLTAEERVSLSEGRRPDGALERAESLVVELLAQRPQLSVLRGPLESLIPSWCAGGLDDAARWIGAGRCLDVHWAPLSLPPPAFVFISADQLTSSAQTGSAEASTSALHAQRPEEWAKERSAALGEPREVEAPPPSWASICSTSFPHSAPFQSTRFNAQ